MDKIYYVLGVLMILWNNIKTCMLRIEETNKKLLGRGLPMLPIFKNGISSIS